MRHITIAAGLALALVGTAASAQTFTAQNHLKVNPLNAMDFEVIEARGEGATGMWCAAADYGMKRLRLSNAQRVYVKTARGPATTAPGRKGVVFTFDASGLTQPPGRSYSVSTGTVGLSMSLGQAIQFCRDNIIEPEDIHFRRKGS